MSRVTVNAAVAGCAAIALGTLVTALLPFIGWLYGWLGVAAVIALGSASAYALGASSWGASGWHLLLTPFALAIVPLAAAIWGLRNADAATLAWIVAAVALFTAATVAARIHRRVRAT